MKAGRIAICALLFIPDRASIALLHPSMVQVKVPLWSVRLALGFSAGMGIFFGIIPAFRAAITHPIDALREE